MLLAPNTADRIVAFVVVVGSSVAVSRVIGVCIVLACVVVGMGMVVLLLLMLLI